MSLRAKRKLLQAVEMLAGVTALCAGVALGIQAGLGQTTSTAVASAIAGAADVKVGTASVWLCGLFFILQLLLLRRNFEAIRCLQILPILAHGALLNFFRYDFSPFQQIVLHSYVEQAVCFLCGMVLISLGFTITKNCGFTNYPAEAFCALVAERLRIRYGTCKIVLDLAYVVVALAICAAADLGFDIVREGTVMFAVCDGLLINWMTPAIRRLFDRMEAKVFPTQ